MRTRHGALLSAIQSEAPRYGWDPSDVGREQDVLRFWWPTTKRIGSSLCYSLTGDNKAGYGNSKSVSATFSSLKKLRFSQEWHQSESRKSHEQHDKPQRWLCAGKLEKDKVRTCAIRDVWVARATQTALLSFQYLQATTSTPLTSKCFLPPEYWGHLNSRTPSWIRNVHGPTDEQRKRKTSQTHSCMLGMCLGRESVHLDSPCPCPWGSKCQSSCSPAAYWLCRDDENKEPIDFYFFLR